MSSSAARALRVLDEIAGSGRPLGVTEIARALSLPPGTVFRSLDALSRAGLVERYRASSSYVPGPAAEQLRRSAVARFPAREVCLPYLRQIASISGETVSLHLKIGWYAVRICSVPGTGDVMLAQPLGEAHPLHQSPAGQVILAGIPKPEYAAYRNWVCSNLPLGEGPTREARWGRGQGSRAPRSRKSEPQQLAFPIRAQARVIATITIDGLAALTGDQQTSCRHVMANIESLAAAQPGLFAGPFSHLDPQAIRF